MLERRKDERREQARLVVSVTPRRLRQHLRLVITLMIVYSQFQLLGVTGVALVLAALTRELKRWFRGEPFAANLTSEGLERAYVSEWLVRVKWREEGGASRWIWVFKDELSLARWCELRRFLFLYSPRQPVGLSISR